MKPRIGIDVGGVIIGRESGKSDTSFFTDNYLASKPTEHCIESIGELVRSGFDVHIVSKCGSKVQKKTLDWMDHHDFYGHTGVRPDAVHFCKERHQKAPICEQLGIKAFVDDKLEVLSYMKAVVPIRILFCPSTKEVDSFPSEELQGVTTLLSWPSVVSHLLRIKPTISY